VIDTNERPARVVGAGNSRRVQAATIHREGRARHGHRIARDHERLGLLLRRRAIPLIRCADNPSRPPDHSLARTNDRGSRGRAPRQVADIKGGSIFGPTQRISWRCGIIPARRVRSSPDVSADPIGTSAPISLGGGPIEFGGSTQRHTNLRRGADGSRTFVSRHSRAAPSDDIGRRSGAYHCAGEGDRPRAFRSHGAGWATRALRTNLAPGKCPRCAAPGHPVRSSRRRAVSVPTGSIARGPLRSGGMIRGTGDPLQVAGTSALRVRAVRCGSARSETCSTSAQRPRRDAGQRRDAAPTFNEFDDSATPSR
jgi:hypothetical protein